jgi:glutamate dehydrogenase (NAD(P)+)
MTGARRRLGDFSLFDEWGPERIVCVADSKTGMRGVLVIDNTARGFAKGGTRMAADVTVEDIARLARVMTWKWAGIDVFLGGAKAGVRADPEVEDKEAVLRAFVRALSNEVPREYVFGLDMGLTERDAAIIQNELGDRGAAVGTPQELGGVPYDEWGATGYGVAEAVEAAADFRGTEIAGCRTVIQGFGAVGAATARRLDELGASIVAVSTVHGALHDPDGLDVGALLDARAELGDRFVLELDGARRLPASTEFELEAEVIVPAAGSGTIDAELARRLRAVIVVEGANLPMADPAKDVLAERGTTVVPDFVANAGGAIAAAYAMETRRAVFATGPTAIFETISTKVRANAQTVLEQARANGTTTHVAAHELAAKRVRRAMELAGRTPPTAG